MPPKDLKAIKMPRDMMSRLRSVSGEGGYVEQLYPHIVKELTTDSTLNGQAVATVVHTCFVEYARGLHPSARSFLGVLMSDVLSALIMDHEVLADARAVINGLPHV